jgi:hypothetical protein
MTSYSDVIDTKVLEGHTASTFTLKKAAVWSSRITTRCDNPKDDLNLHHPENLKSRKGQ